MIFLHLLGREIMTVYEGKIETNNKELTFNTERLYNGIYILVMQTPGARRAKLFVVNR
jgi:hypothetical protein